MSELDDFRPRIWNWARVFGNSFIRHESNIMPFLRSIDKEASASESRAEPDYRDAEFVDLCISALRQRSEDFEAVYSILSTEYLSPFPRDYESEAEAKKALKAKAKVAGVFPWKYYEGLRRAEQMLMVYVERKEEA